jgi:cytoskeleton-associated protein 5
LNALFDAIPSARPIASRWKRGAKPKELQVPLDTESAPVSEEIPSAAVAAEQHTIPDTFDLADPVNFIDRLPKSFYSDLVWNIFSYNQASMKWKERKEAVEQLLKLISFPKLEDGRYFELLNVLAKRLADPNVVVVVLVAKAIEKLALGLKNCFSQYRNIVTAPLLERMKEKKSNVLDALRSAVDAVIASLSSFGDVLDDIGTSMAHSNPTIRVESFGVITRFLKSPRALKRFPKGDIKNSVEKVLKVLI